MDSSAIPVFLAGPFPVLHVARVHDVDDEVELDVALIIRGAPTVLTAARFPIDEGWDRIETALESGDARLGVAGVPHEAESLLGTPEVYPSAYVGLECANGERLVLAHIRAARPGQGAERYARRVIGEILKGRTPTELGEPIQD